LRSCRRWESGLRRTELAIYGTERNNFDWHVYANFTQRGNTAYAHVTYWPGDTPAEEWLTFYQPPSVISLGGWKTKVKSVRLLVGDKAPLHKTISHCASLVFR
jgi:hypothetical protein